VAPEPMKTRACVYHGMDWGGEADEAWIASDSCSLKDGLVPITWTSSPTLVKEGEGIFTSSAHAASPADAFQNGYSSLALWWAGQLTAQALASFGKCGVLAAQSLSRTLSSSRAPPESNKRTALAKTSLKQKRSTEPSFTTEVLSMHIRRGDSCMRWAQKRGDAGLQGGRPCFPTELYLEAARQMRDQYGFTTLHLATDSSAASKQVTQALSAEGWTVVALSYDRGSVGGSDAANAGKRVDQGTVYIEDRLKSGDPSLDAELVIGSLAAEMELLSSGAALVGTSSSWVTRLSFLAMVGRRGTTPPFIFLDAPFGCLNIRPCAIK